MTELSGGQRQAVAGVLGVAAHALAHAWREDGPEDLAVQDAIAVAALIGWTESDLRGLWAIALELCDRGILDA